MANSVEPDHMRKNEVSALGLHHFLRHVCPNTMAKYDQVCDSVLIFAQKIRHDN